MLIDSRLIFLLLTKFVIVTFKVNFSQDLYEVINKEGKVIFAGHRTVDNCYVINSNSKTSLMCSGLSLMSLNYDTEG